MSALPPELEVLVAAARAVQKRAYAPYSSFSVGAALRSASGQIFVGCNVENASYGATICAERSAVLAMVAAGERHVAAIAVFTDGATLAMPCGLCRQVLAEFSQGALVIVANPREERVVSLTELFPEPFVLER